MLLEEFAVRLIEDSERQRFDEELTNKHYLKNVLVGWMQTQDTAPLWVVHVDSKVVKNAQPAPPRSQAQQEESAWTEPCEIPPELQKPKADKALIAG
jgi:hypothetical protein